MFCYTVQVCSQTGNQGLPLEKLLQTYHPHNWMKGQIYFWWRSEISLGQYMSNCYHDKTEETCTSCKLRRLRSQVFKIVKTGSCYLVKCFDWFSVKNFFQFSQFAGIRGYSLKLVLAVVRLLGVIKRLGNSQSVVTEWK